MDEGTKSGQQEQAESDVKGFKQDLGPFVVAAETTRMPMVFLDALGAGRPIVFANDAFLSLTRYTREELLGKSLSSLIAQGHDSDGLDLFEIAFEETSEDDQLMRFCRRDGSVFWATVFISPVRDDSNKVVQYFVSLVDLTRHLQEEERQRFLLHELSQGALGTREARLANEAKTHFLASMSHEIRSPLNGIIGYTEQLMDANLEPGEHRLAGRIQNASSMLLAIVDDILDFSQIEAGRIKLETRSFSLGALIDSAVSIVFGSAEEKGLALRYELDPNLPALVIGDEARLRQVILNLLTNAVKFTHRGHIDLAVESEGQSADRATIQIRVSDTGIGIAADRLHLLFKRFSQVDPSIRREFGGSGLGLAISKRLIELMGGDIGVDSTHGEGSTFWIRVTLPVATTADIPPAEEGPSANAASALILVAEDMEMNQDIVRAILEKAGHRVDVVDDGAKAVAALEETPYDLVLMDIWMPVMDGMAATKAIRALESPRRDIPIIAMTANVLPHQVRSFKQAGLDDHIAKPLKRSDLLKKLNEWLSKPPPGAEPSPGDDRQ